MTAKSKRRSAVIVQTISDGILTLDPQGVVTYANAAAERLMGRKKGAMTGAAIQSLVSRESVETVNERVRDMAAPTGTAAVFELQVAREESGKAVLEVKCDPVQKGAALDGAVWVLRDVTFRNELEQKRAEFFATLTHDIKNALGIIMSSAEILIMKAKQTDARQDEKILDRMMNNTLTVQTLVTSYLDLSMIESGQLHLARKAIDLNAVLRWVARQHEVAAERRGIALELHLAPALPAIEGDPICLERIFANLLHNALKFTPDNGRVTVRSGTTDREVAGEILDTGLGIAAADLAHIFQKYRRGSAGSNEGLGLGLFIVKELVEAHGGRVQVQSNPGSGSCFSVFFPAGAGGD